MKRNLLWFFLLTITGFTSIAQVTRLSNNTSYDWAYTFSDTRIILHAGPTDRIWAYDIPGTFTLLSGSMIVEETGFGLLNGKVIFAGKTVAEGTELWITDGTPGGTTLLKDINTTGDSNPQYGFIEYNGELYFTADDGSSGRELWKTNGSGPGTVRVKDINTGPGDAFTNSIPTDFKIVNGVLVFPAITAADGDELWKTDGTDPGTSQLKNIYTTATYGSYISSFTEYGSILVFTAFDATNGQGLWKTDGTTAGTTFIKDVDVVTPVFGPPFPYYVFTSIISQFFNFQNVLYFTASDGVNGFELWKTDGTGPGTSLLKDIDPGDDGMGTPNNGTPQLFLAVKNNSKFFFSATTAAEGAELWQSDGTGPGTTLLKDVEPGATGSDLTIFPKFFGSGLFQGNKFFFAANRPGSSGNELYISDGTSAGTTLVKDINPGPGDGCDPLDLLWLYTDSKLYFKANDGVTGSELWQSDGTGTGTSLVADINTTSPGAGSGVLFCALTSTTLFFFATDGDDPGNTDFFQLDATIILPLRWVAIEARPDGDNVSLLWETADEEQTDYFIIQRSSDGTNYHDIGRTNANGGISNHYQFMDVGAMTKAGVKKWYYRIRNVDKDGKSLFSRIASVALNKPITSILILPNPVAKELKLLVEAANDDHGLLTITNMEGRIVWQRAIAVRKGENKINTDVGNLSNGVYLLQINVGGSGSTEKFIIQH